MRQKIQYTSGETQPRPSFAVGKLPDIEAGNFSVSFGTHPPSASFGIETASGNHGTGEAVELSRSYPQRARGGVVSLLIFLITLYQRYISPWIPCQCRFVPTCSHYAVEALQIRGFWVGIGLTVWRLLRCQPFCRGGYDPVSPAPGSKEK